MFFFRIHFRYFQAIVHGLCKEHGYMMWTDDQTYRFLDYVEKEIVNRLDSNICFAFRDLIRKCFAEFDH